MANDITADTVQVSFSDEVSFGGKAYNARRMTTAPVCAARGCWVSAGRYGKMG